MRFPRPLVVVVAGAGALVGWTSSAGAFVEDLCFGDGGVATNCYPLPSACEPAGSITADCKAASFKLFVANGAGDPAVGVRSTVHTDSVDLIAQAVGFSATDAYWIAAYSGSVDYGRAFVPYDTEGNPVTTWNDASTATVPLVGFDRLTNSVSVPSFFMHFITPYHGGSDTPVPGINGLAPDVTDATTEPELASLQRWALADFPGASGAAPMCSAGLTVLDDKNFGSGASCFVGQGDVPGRVGGSTAAAGTVAISLEWASGTAVIELVDGGSPTYATDFDTYVGAHAADARLGVFLHVLSDRVSHFRCEDNGALTGPTPGPDGGFFADLTNSDCEQPVHALYHLWEVGLPFDLDAGVGLTTTSVLSDLYDQLVVFATAKGVLRSGASAPSAESALVGAIAGALQTPDPALRVAALAHVACADGLEAFPGAPACPDAGSPPPSKDGGSSEGGAPKDAGAGQVARGPKDATVVANQAAPADAESASSGCSTSPRRAADGAWALGLFGLAALTRRRRSLRP